MDSDRETDAKLSRRQLLKGVAATALASGAAACAAQRPSDPVGPARTRSSEPLLAAVPTHTVIDPTPRHELSPNLYMQMMEPLGATDSSVEAAWDHRREDWREDLVETMSALAPPMLRWGGLFDDYYHWREGVGPRDQRVPMVNLLWQGIESNQVGTAEVVDLCERVGAAPLICVNFESDGRTYHQHAPKGYGGNSVRIGDAREAADWVAYCNQADHAERIAHGRRAPLGIKWWQIGNETSIHPGAFDLETAARKTREFARGMRRADPDIAIIAWGESGWAPRMLEVAGDEIDMLAFHHHFDPDDERQPVLRGEFYRRDPEATWQQLMKAWEISDRKIRSMRDSLGGADVPLALTECHFVVPGRDRCDVMSTWATGVAYARLLNNHQRHGDALKIATAADFCGTRWQTNALMIPVPSFVGKTYMMPVARVMKLYRHHVGERAVEVVRSADGLDVVASRSGDRLFLHVANTLRQTDVATDLSVVGTSIRRIVAHEIVEDPMVEVTHLNAEEVMQERSGESQGSSQWRFPAASVSALEIELET